MRGHVARAEVTIDATPQRAWHALTDPETVRQWMVGTEVRTDWRGGSPLTWQGELHGRAYQDRGEGVRGAAPHPPSRAPQNPPMGHPGPPGKNPTPTPPPQAPRDFRPHHV